MKNLILKLLQNYLAVCSRLYLSKTSPTIIGITGSVGKTSCRVIIHQVLTKFLKEKKVYSSPKNFNSEIGLPFSIFSIENYDPGVFNLLKISLYISFQALFSKPDYDVIVLEYGLDYAYMDLLLKSAKPDIAIFTKLDSIHLEFFDSIEDIGKEKFKLITSAKKKVYLNYKDDFCRKEFDSIKKSKSYYSGKDIEVKNYEPIKEKENILAKFELGNKTLKTNLLGEENSDYIALAFDILKELGEKNLEIGKNKEIYLDLELQPGRFRIFKGIKNSILIDSSYNAGSESMKKMIENTFLLHNKLFSDYSVSFVLGDMRELGKDTEKAHKSLFLCFKKPSSILTIGKEMREYFIPEMLRQNKTLFLKSFLSSKEAGKELKNILEKDDKKHIILFKGSQNTIFTEEALKEVLENKDDEKHLVRQNDLWMKKK